jgi:hypothetical protein
MVIAGSEEKQISRRSSYFDELGDRSFDAATGEDGRRAGRRRLSDDRHTERLGLRDVKKEEHSGQPLTLSAGAAWGRRSALWCRIAPVAWLGDGASRGGLDGWSSRLHLVTASRRHSWRQLSSSKDGHGVLASLRAMAPAQPPARGAGSDISDSAAMALDRGSPGQRDGTATRDGNGVAAPEWRRRDNFGTVTEASDKSCRPVSLMPVRATGGRHTTMANGSTTPGDRVTNRWAPRVSGFKISINSKIDHSHGKNIQAGRKNLEKIEEIGIPIWINFCY